MESAFTYNPESTWGFYVMNDSYVWSKLSEKFVLIQQNLSFFDSLFYEHQKRL